MYCYKPECVGGEDCFAVGFHQTSGTWIQESFHGTSEEAARRVNYLNGGTGDMMPDVES